uniref:ymf101 n=1 Tax=Peronosclerospora sorghi TaxID=230839 RepID=UPI0022FD72F7|nr:ymf101 [Peronosclerospora sorghi]WAU47967.1 ymf101 [Peronosclerospora sorghi]
MHKNKNFFTYKNKIILTNGASLKITSIKYFKNYQINLKIFQSKKNIKNINKNFKLNFFEKII